MKDEPFNTHIDSARHSLQALRGHVGSSTGVPGVEITGHLGAIESALAALQTKIAEGARVELAMRASEEQLRGFFHASPSGMAVLDTELRYLRINERLADMNGQPVEAHFGKTVREILPAFAPIIEPLCRQVLINEKPILDHELGGETTRAAGMDGDWIISYFPVPDWNGTPAALGVMVTDISVRKRAEEALRESEERYRQLFEAESDAIILMDSETGQALEANAAAAKLYGYSHAELLTLKHSDVTAEPQKTRQAFAAHETRIPLRWHRKKDGTVFPVEITGSYFESQGRPVHVAAIRDITERKRAEEALWESEEKYRTAVEHASEGITIAQDGVYVFTNHRMSEFLGVPAAILEGKPFIEFVWPEDREMVMANYRKRVAGEAIPSGYDFRIIGAGGKLAWISLSAARIQWKGRPATIDLITDITERKRTEEALRESEEQYRRLFENSMLAISQASPDGRLVRVNMAYARMYGYASPEQMIAEVTDIGHQLYANPGDRQEVRRILSAKGVMGPREMAVVRRDGTRFYVEVLAQENRDASGKLLSYQASHIDITDRKRAERKLIESEAMLRALFEGSSYSMGLAKDGIQLMVNHAFVELFGYANASDVIGKPIFNDIAPEERPRVQEFARHRIQGEPAPAFYETLGIKRDGTVFDMAVAVSTYELDGEIHTIGILRDITKRKRAEEERLANLHCCIGGSFIFGRILCPG
jgi:PAS domain S-box-containing protein